MARDMEDRVISSPLTLEEQERLFAVLERLRLRREAMLAARGGRLFRPAGEDLDELRAERDDELS